jgi:ribosomal protein L23
VGIKVKYSPSHTHQRISLVPQERISLKKTIALAIVFYYVVIVQKCNHLNYDMELYNARRPHAKLQYKTPDQKEQEFALRSNGK